MDLIECPSCAGQVSEKAASCPHCGHPFKAQSTIVGINLRDPIHLIGLAVAGLMILSTIIYIIVSFVSG